MIDKTVDVVIPVEPEAAAALADGRNREAVGRLVSRIFRPASGSTPLARVIAEIKEGARASGLSDAEIDLEIAADNADRRGRGPDGWSFSMLRPLSAPYSRRTAFLSALCCMPKKSMCWRSLPQSMTKSPRYSAGLNSRAPFRSGRAAAF